MERTADWSQRWRLREIPSDELSILDHHRSERRSKPDLVLTADTTKVQQVWDATGSPYWKVFLNTGSGFGPAMNWPVPRKAVWMMGSLPRMRTSHFGAGAFSM